MAIAYLGLGANLGDREENLRRALSILGHRGVEILAVSAFRETAPVGGPSQPPFLNAVAKVETDLSPEDLLAEMKEAERAVGRGDTGVRWGPREADLDLLLYGDLVLTTGDLTVPHPRMSMREFVLEPLTSIAPDVRDPVTGRTATELLTDLRSREKGMKSVRRIRTLAELGKYVRMVDRNRFSLGLVPTMGAFHDGHLSLIRQARLDCDKVAVSLFVNPTQFGPGEDFEAYPRPLDEDLALAAEAGADIVFTPSRKEIYPEGYATWVEVKGLSERLCGESRPGHFRGVTTIVTKLLNLFRPNVIYLGAKDFQQTVILRRMVRDLELEVDLRVLPTVREPDGLAMSSRNAYLSPGERQSATSLWRGLSAAKQAYDDGERIAESLVAAVREVLEEADDVVPEYVVVADRESLEPVPLVVAPAVLLLAARVGETRLLDNVELGDDA